LLRDARINVLAASGLAAIDDPDVGRMLVKRYRNFRAPQRPKIVSLLSSRVSFAHALVEGIEHGKIPRDDLSAFQVRQIQNLGDVSLRRRVAEVWGEVRDTPAEKKRVIDSLKRSLTPERLESADRRAGRALFTKTCQNCHRLYGEGGEVGPDLTGANRNNLDYLLGNIVDPSGVVDKDYRMTILVTDDGRVLSGLVTGRTQRTITLHTATESVTLDRQSIVDEKVTEKSPMPEGLLDNLDATQIRDLTAYLTHPSQVPLPDDAG
jgi:putative heme-binding domain-containing protein